MRRNPWFQPYISQGERRERIIEIMEKGQQAASERAFTGPYLEPRHLIDYIPCEEDEVTHARLETVRCVAVSRAYAPHAAAVRTMGEPLEPNAR